MIKVYLLSSLSHQKSLFEMTSVQLYSIYNRSLRIMRYLIFLRFVESIYIRTISSFTFNQCKCRLICTIQRIPCWTITSIPIIS
ncbi:hypothetical protein I4U23_010227 [Adineta vaga]|nr:hypothetical protein I4U23_010227 [Adineta vaga]